MNGARVESHRGGTKRRDFDTVREWVATANGFKPAKLSGPLLYLDSHKAWSARLTPDAPKKKPKRLTAKELRQLIQAYRNMLDRSGGVILPKWKGKITEAHQLRAQFFRACVGESPPSLRIPTASWWLGMRGKLPREMIADAAARIDEAA